MNTPGIQANVKTRNGDTPLRLAIRIRSKMFQHGYDTIIACLSSPRVSRNNLDSEGQTEEESLTCKMRLQKLKYDEEIGWKWGTTLQCKYIPK